MDKNEKVQLEYFNSLCDLVTFMQSLMPALATHYKLLKKRKIVTETWKKWMPKYLYANAILNVRITGGKLIHVLYYNLCSPIWLILCDI